MSKPHYYAMAVMAMAVAALQAQTPFTISTVFPPPGGQPSSGILGPTGVAVDSSGNVFVADTVGNRVYKYSSGVLTVVAGTGAPGYNGDSIAATSAELNGP